MFVCVKDSGEWWPAILLHGYKVIEADRFEEKEGKEIDRGGA